MTPAALKYSVTTCEPGARLVLTHGLTLRPRAAAFWASRPAAIITDGFDVLVQLVMAAMTTSPWCSGKLPRSVVTSRLTPRAPGGVRLPSLTQPSIAAASAAGGVEAPTMPASDLRQTLADWRRGTRSCGRLGPASDGSTDDRSR